MISSRRAYFEKPFVVRFASPALKAWGSGLGRWAALKGFRIYIGFLRVYIGVIGYIGFRVVYCDPSSMART